MWGAIFVGLMSRPWVWRLTGMALFVLAIALFLFSLRRAGERAGRAAERLVIRVRTDAIQRQMLEAASRRPRDRDDLLERLRKGGF